VHLVTTDRLTLSQQMLQGICDNRHHDVITVTVLSAVNIFGLCQKVDYFDCIVSFVFRVH